MKTPFIMVAPTGARRTQADHAALPITTDEIVATTRACHAAGADALHLHVRDADGTHSLDAARYRETIAAIRDHLPDLPIQITTESADLFDVPAQLACLRATQPEWASISIREIHRDPSLAPKIYGTCADNGTRVQHILYGADDVALLADWQARGIVRPDQTDVICVLGRYTAGQTSSPADLIPFLDVLPKGTPFMACAFGPDEHACLAFAAQNGGALRVGFENSLGTDRGQHADNAASVAALRDLLNARPDTNA